MAVSNMIIELNGTVITGRVDGLDSFEVTVRRKNEENRIAKSFTSELTFFDDGYQIIRTVLMDNPNGFAAEVLVKIWDSCCEKESFSGIISGDAIDWCEPGCSVTANVVETKPELNCIKSTLIYDNHNGFMEMKHPSIRYCVETRPQFIQFAMLYLVIILNQIFTAILLSLISVIFVIFGLIYIFCNITNFICGLPIIGCDQQDCNSGWNNPISVIQQITGWFQDLNESIIQCGRFHPSPYLRDYIQNVCTKCGVSFSSSILNNPGSLYYNTVLFAAQVEKGNKQNDTDYRLIRGNEPILTLEQLLNDYIIPVYNADWRLVGNTLVIERKDYFNLTTVWIDTEALLDAGDIIDDQVCYNWIDKERWAFGNFQYQPDAIEIVGNEGKNRYNDIVEWNSPYNPAQSGERNMQLPISPARFRNDGLDIDVYSSFDQSTFGLGDALLFGALSAWEHALIMSQHTAFQFKFLIYDQANSTLGEAMVQRNYSNVITGGDPVQDQPAANTVIPQDFRYNYPYWFYEGLDNNLYSNFHYIDDPRLPGAVQFDFSFSFQFNCQQLADFSFDKTVRLIKNGAVCYGTMDELKIDYNKRLITVTGKV